MRSPVEHLLATTGCLMTSDPLPVSDDALSDSVTLEVPYPTSNLLSDGGPRAGPDQRVVYTMFGSATTVYKVETNMTRRAVVQRDDDVLTPQQLDEHWPEVEQAMLKELQTWAKLKCFRRKPLQHARNIDTR